MVMPYNWERENFIEQIKILRRMVDEETDFIKKIHYKDTLIVLIRYIMKPLITFLK